MKYNQTCEKQVNEKINKASTCNVLLLRKLILDIIGPSLGLIRDKLTCNVALKAPVFRLFLALGLVKVTADKGI